MYQLQPTQMFFRFIKTQELASVILPQTHVMHTDAVIGTDKATKVPGKKLAIVGM